MSKSKSTKSTKPRASKVAKKATKTVTEVAVTPAPVAPTAPVVSKKRAFRIPKPEYMVAKYLRDKNKNPIGLVVAMKVNDRVSIGWSLTHKNDKYDKNKAWATAMGRAATGTKAILPYRLNAIYCEIIDRAARYFKVPEHEIFLATGTADVG
jgi:hypothetical protein